MPETDIITRRSDLDWIRIGAFGLLILYHIALFFSPWEWHLNSRHPLPWVGETLVATNPWRLTLLFFISGVAVRFMARKRRLGRLVADRSRRLLLPLLFGVVVLVPPQAYLEKVAKNGLQLPYPEFWERFFSHDIPLNHLWFIGYIWAYSLVAALLLASPALIERIEGVVARALAGPRIVFVPVAYLALARLLLFPHFDATNHLLNDWYNHAAWLGVFLLGCTVAFQTRFWGDVERYRWMALAIALASGIMLAIDAALPVPDQHPKAPGTMICFAVNQWSAIAAILGFGARHLANSEGPVLDYLRRGIFPFYLVHQTIIIIAAYYVDRWVLPVSTEFVLLLSVTLIGCLAVYEGVRRSPALRPLFGLG
ncbi:MAG: acetyltransferase [Rhizorhabdus sp.]|nr:acetyltransferase [Rhizorhabdus sp.]